jgi:hypothetical protein
MAALFKNLSSSKCSSCSSWPEELHEMDFPGKVLAALRECFKTHGVPDTELCKFVDLRLKQWDAHKEVAKLEEEEKKQAEKGRWFG